MKIAVCFLFCFACWGQCRLVLNPITKQLDCGALTSLSSGFTGVLPVANGGTLSNNRYLLRSWQSQVGRLRRGATSGVTANICVIGDSWVAGSTITDQLRSYFWGSFGDGGYGWAPAGNSDGTPNGVTLTTTGTWSNTDSASALGIDGSDSSSTDASTPAKKDWYAISEGATLYYVVQPNGGSFRWQVDSGSWTTVDTAGTLALGRVDFPAQTHALHHFTAELTVSGSAGVKLLGLDLQNANGVRVHRIGNSGFTSGFYSTLFSQSMVRSQAAALGCDLFLVGLGVNDSNSAIAPATYATNMSSLLSSLQTAAPTADVAFWGQTDSGYTGLTYTLDQYLYPLQSYAATSGVGYIDTYRAIGPFSNGRNGIYGATITTLSGALTSTATSVSVASGASITNGDVLLVDRELILVSAGGGTGTLTVARNQSSTIQIPHASGAGVINITTQNQHPNTAGGAAIAAVIQSYLTDGIDYGLGSQRIRESTTQGIAEVFGVYSNDLATARISVQNGNVRLGGDGTDTGYGFDVSHHLPTNGTTRFYDGAAGGITRVEIREGLSQSTNRALSVMRQNGTTCALCTTPAGVSVGTSSAYTGYSLGVNGNTYFSGDVIMADWWVARQGATHGIGFGSGHRIVWASGTTNTSANPSGDTGLARSAAGTLKVTDGSTGTGTLIVKFPTSCSGLDTGTAWNNGGTLAVCP